MYLKIILYNCIEIEKSHFIKYKYKEILLKLGFEKDV